MISEKLIEEKVEILPHWTNGRPSIVVRKGNNVEYIECVRSVLYHGSIEGMPKEISMETLKFSDSIDLPDQETLKFALRSFCEAICELYPESLEEDMMELEEQIYFDCYVKKSNEV